MKNLSLFILFISLLILSSCHKNSIEPAYYIHATLGSEPFKYEGNTYLASSSGSYSKIFIVAAYPDNQSSLTFATTTPLIKAPATLKIDYAEYYGGAGKSYYASSGSCTITKFDGKVVEGTFYFDAYSTGSAGTLKVKDGRFRLKYN